VSLEQPFNFIHVSFHDNDMGSYLMESMVEIHDEILMGVTSPSDKLEAIREVYRKIHNNTPGGISVMYTRFAALRGVLSKFRTMLIPYPWNTQEQVAEWVEGGISGQFNHYKNWMSDLTVEFHVDDSFLFLLFASVTACDKMVTDCVEISKNKKTRTMCRNQLIHEFRDAFLVYGRH
jgi:hypothetical protein